MTMHRSEHTDSDTSQRFPINPSTASSSTPLATADVRNTDILSGRGKSYTKHPGNLRFDDIIKQNLRRYFSVSTHTDKKTITEEIVNEVTSLGRFLRHDKAQEKWLVMDREAARIKVAQALQYRQRRVSKGLESIDDSLEPNPLPPSHQEHTQRRSSVQPMQAPVVASLFDQDIGLARRPNGPQQEQQPRWGAAHRHGQEQICMPQQSNNLSQSFDFDIDTSIGVAAANNQLQQQQMDQQHLDRQINGLLSQRVLQHLSDTSGHHHLGPPYNAGATQQSISLLHPNDGIQAPSNVSQQHDALLLEPRPLPFHNQNAAVTGLPHRFSTDSTINRDDLLFRPMRTTSVPTSQLGNHRQPPHYTQTQQNQLLTAAPQHQQEEIDNASLSDLLTEDVEDDIVSDGNEPEDWDEPTFPDGAGSTTFHR